MEYDVRVMARTKVGWPSLDDQDWLWVTGVTASQQAIGGKQALFVGRIMSKCGELLPYSGYGCTSFKMIHITILINDTDTLPILITII